MKRCYVILLMAIVFFGIWIADYYLYHDSIARNSFSQIIIDLSKESHLVPFLIGLFMGGLAVHWFET